MTASRFNRDDSKPTRSELVRGISSGALLTALFFVPIAILIYIEDYTSSRAKDYSWLLLATWVLPVLIGSTVEGYFKHSRARGRMLSLREKADLELRIFRSLWRFLSNFVPSRAAFGDSAMDLEREFVSRRLVGFKEVSAFGKSIKIRSGLARRICLAIDTAWVVFECYRVSLGSSLRESFRLKVPKTRHRRKSSICYQRCLSQPSLGVQIKFVFALDRYVFRCVRSSKRPRDYHGLLAIEEALSVESGLKTEFGLLLGWLAAENSNYDAARKRLLVSFNVAKAEGECDRALVACCGLAAVAARRSRRSGRNRSTEYDHWVRRTIKERDHWIGEAKQLDSQLFKFGSRIPVVSDIIRLEFSRHLHAIRGGDRKEWLKTQILEALGEIAPVSDDRGLQIGH